MVTRARIDPQRRLSITGSPFDPFVKAVFPSIADRVPSWVSPNAMSAAGAVASVTAGTLIAFSGRVPVFLLVATALVMTNWLTDTLDGMMARRRNQGTKLGEFLDHALDGVTVAALCIGPALSGLTHPELPLLQGLLILLAFALTFKGERATGVTVLLTFGPTEVRMVLSTVLIATFFHPGALGSIYGYSLSVLDITALFGIFWASVYCVVLFVRFTRQLRILDRSEKRG